MNTKITYTTTEGNTFRTIAQVLPEGPRVLLFLINNYDMEGITEYSFRPSVKLGYKKYRNIRVKL